LITMEPPSSGCIKVARKATALYLFQ
jgi:hypothetical protein